MLTPDALSTMDEAFYRAAGIAADAILEHAPELDRARLVTATRHELWLAVTDVAGVAIDRGSAVLIMRSETV